MNVYVVTGSRIEEGTFRSFDGQTVHYRTEDGLKTEHTRNVFFKKQNARHHLVRTFGITRPILNGSS